MSYPLTIDVPELAVSAETERPIEGAERVRVYIGPEIELVLTPTTAERIVDALVDAIDTGGVVRPAAAVPGWVGL